MIDCVAFSSFAPFTANKDNNMETWNDRYAITPAVVSNVFDNIVKNVIKKLSKKKDLQQIFDGPPTFMRRLFSIGLIDIQ